LREKRNRCGYDSEIREELSIVVDDCLSWSEDVFEFLNIKD
jgi:hypothetical protein